MLCDGWLGDRQMKKDGFRQLLLTASEKIRLSNVRQLLLSGYLGNEDEQRQRKNAEEM